MADDKQEQVAKFVSSVVLCIRPELQDVRIGNIEPD